MDADIIMLVSSSIYFPPEHIRSSEIMDRVRPTRDQIDDAKGQRVYLFKNKVACFPYPCHTPSESCVGLGFRVRNTIKKLMGVFPFMVVVFFPWMLRGPPAALTPRRYLRSNRILREGQWRRVVRIKRLSRRKARSSIAMSSVLFQFHFQHGRFRAQPGAVALPSPVTCSQDRTLLRLADGQHVGACRPWWECEGHL